jgi:hypothetical protein
VRSGPKKIVEIVVTQARGLSLPGRGRREDPMRPFFSYNFYKFEYTSATVDGSDANFMSEKHFEVESNKDFMDYLQKMNLKIDFIDESVDIEEHGAVDYIGTARIPLLPLIKHAAINGEFPVTNERGLPSGKIHVAIRIQDAALAGYVDGIDDQYSAGQTSTIQAQTVTKICDNFAKQDLPDLELFLGMLFAKGE